MFEGDSGGQTYATVPVRHVRCTDAALETLSADLDRLGWDDEEGRQWSIDRQPMGEWFGGGMGGAIVVDGLWLHAELEAPDLRERIEAVLRGDRERIAVAEKGELRFAGHVGEDFAFTAPDDPLPLSDGADDLLESVNDALQEHRPEALDRVRSTVEVFAFGEIRIVLAHRTSDLRAVLLGGPSGPVRLNLVRGEVDAEVDLDADLYLEDTLGALFAGRVEARPVIDEDPGGDWTSWFLRVWPPEDGAETELGDTLNLDVFTMRLGAIVDVGSFAR